MLELVVPVIKSNTWNYIELELLLYAYSIITRRQINQIYHNFFFLVLALKWFWFNSTFYTTVVVSLVFSAQRKKKSFSVYWWNPTYFSRIARPIHGLGLRTMDMLDVSLLEEVYRDHNISSGFIVDTVCHCLGIIWLCIVLYIAL